MPKIDVASLELFTETSEIETIICQKLEETNYLTSCVCVCISCSSILECYFFFSKILKFIFQFIWKAEGGRAHRQVKRDHPSIYWFPAQIPVMAMAGHQICLFMASLTGRKIQRKIYVTHTHWYIHPKLLKRSLKKNSKQKAFSSMR